MTEIFCRKCKHYIPNLFNPSSRYGAKVWNMWCRAHEDIEKAIEKQQCNGFTTP